MDRCEKERKEGKAHGARRKEGKKDPGRLVLFERSGVQPPEVYERLCSVRG